MLDVFASIKTPIIKDNYTCKETLMRSVNHEVSIFHSSYWLDTRSICYKGHLYKGHSLILGKIKGHEGLMTSLPEKIRDSLLAIIQGTLS